MPWLLVARDEVAPSIPPPVGEKGTRAHRSYHSRACGRDRGECSRLPFARPWSYWVPVLTFPAIPASQERRAQFPSLLPSPRRGVTPAWCPLLFPFPSPWKDRGPAPASPSIPAPVVLSARCPLLFSRPWRNSVQVPPPLAATSSVLVETRRSLRIQERPVPGALCVRTFRCPGVTAGAWLAVMDLSLGPPAGRPEDPGDLSLSRNSR